MLKFQIFQRLHFDISFADALLHMSKFASTFKSLLSNKENLFELANTPLNENYLAVLLKKLPEKLGDPGKFLIPCDFSKLDECLALADLGASINLMPVSVWKKLSPPELTSTRMTLELANRSVAISTGVAEDVFVKVRNFYFLADFVVVDYDVNPQAATFKVGHTSRYFRNSYDETVHQVNVIDVTCDVYAQEVLGFSDSSTSGNPTPSDPIISSSSPLFTPFEGSDFILEDIETFLRTSDELTNLNDDYYDTVGDILYLEKLLNEDPSPNLPLMKNQDLNPWVSPVHCVPKKGGMTVIENEDNELIPTRCMMDIFYDMIEETMEILLLQEFDVIIRDKKGAENLAADHLSRLENPHQCDLEKKEINETFPLETPGMVASLSDSSTLCDRGTHFCNDQFAKVMLKYGVTHRLSTAYHLQTSVQVEVSNRGLILSLERTVGENCASWSDKDSYEKKVIQVLKIHTDDNVADLLTKVTPKLSHLHAMKQIFRYLKGQPKLGLWYPRDSAFDLESYSDSDYARANLDRKSTTGGCQFLSRRLISWQCKKQTIVATSTTGAEDSYEKKLIHVLKIHTDDNVADLLTKAFDVSRFLQLFLNNQLKDLPDPFNDTYETPNHSKKVFSNMARKSISFPRKVNPLFDSMLVQNQEPEGEVSHEPQTKAHIEQILPSLSTYQRKHRKTHKHRRAKKVTKLPQTSVPLDLENNEAIHKEGGNCMERAITTDASLVAALDSDNITKTQSTAMSNDPISQEIGSGDGPRRQETTLGGADAQTRLKLRVRRLEKKRKVRTSQPIKKRLFKARVETSTDKSLGEDASKQGRNDDKIEELNLTDEADTKVIIEYKGSGEKGGSTVDQVSTARLKVSTASVLLLNSLLL
nr:reverse transcriptase domain-containing protein [Tanacetum cinerariifolium]